MSTATTWFDYEYTVAVVDRTPIIMRRGGWARVQSISDLAWRPVLEARPAETDLDEIKRICDRLNAPTPDA